jgi:hypothetical protein
MRSVVHHVAGPEQPYPTLRFSDRIYVDLPNHNPFKNAGRLYDGQHDGLADAASLIDTAAPFVDDQTGNRVLNLTDGSEAIITSNTTTEVFGALADGVDNDWDIGDEYEIIET